MQTPSQTDFPRHYAITIREQIDARRQAWFDGMTLTALEDATLIAGVVVDQAALYGLLNRIRDLGMTVLALSSNAVEEPGRPATEQGDRMLR